MDRGVRLQSAKRGCKRASRATSISKRARPQRVPLRRVYKGPARPTLSGSMPKDSFDREINYLRISVIDNCNLRCVYCMPLEGLRFLPREELLTPSEIELVVRAAVSVGFRKFRLTGGEPTLRADLIEIIERLAAVPGLGDLALTTNALLLPKLAR